MLDLAPVPARAIDGVRTHLDERAAHVHARHDLACDGACRHAHRGLARRLPPSSAIIAQAVFDVVGEVGVARPVLVLDVGIILGALIDIIDDERNWRPGRHLRAARFVDEDARQDAHRIRLLALRGEARLARPALVEPGLDIGFRERNARRAAVDHAADRRPVALAEGRDPEKVAEGVERHVKLFGFGAPRCGSPRAPGGQIAAQAHARGMIRYCATFIPRRSQLRKKSETDLPRSKMS